MPPGILSVHSTLPLTPNMNMITFTEYSTPPPNARFSKSWFQSLTVDDAIRISGYPRIAPENSLKHWVFGPDVPTGARATTITPSEVVLSNSDLAPIYKEWERSYNEDGSRSVYLSYSVDGEEYQYVVSFAKVSSAMTAPHILKAHQPTRFTSSSLSTTMTMLESSSSGSLTTSSIPQP